MLYKPNFCCNCGEKIERMEWNLLTSRRFCPSCSPELKRHDLLPRASVVAGGLALMFGFGSLWAGSEAAPPAATAQPVGIRTAVAPTANVQPVIEAQPVTAEPNQARVAEPQGPAETRNSAAYFCGALTKKGTPCSRKVKVKGGRCFQHEGRPEAPRSE